MSRYLSLALLVPTLALGVELADPTRPTIVEEAPAMARDASTPGLRLTGIFLSPRSRSAIINGQRVAIGEEIAGARVAEIAAGSVALEQNGEPLSLSLLPVRIKQQKEFIRGGR